MRLKIRTKVLLIGAAITVALMSLAFFLSVNVYKSNARSILLSDVNKSVSEIDDFFLDKTQQDSMHFVRDYIIDRYIVDPEPCPYENLDERHAYFQDKYGALYDTPGMGLSEDKLQRQISYRDISSKLISSLNNTDAKGAFLAYYDIKNDRYIYLVDYSYILGDNYKEDTRFPGDFYQITEKDRSYHDDSDKSEKVYYTYNLGGKTTKYSDIFVGGLYFCTVFVEYDEQVIDLSMRNFITTEIIAFSSATVVMVAIFVLLSHFAFTKNLAKLNESARRFSENASSGGELSVIDPNIKSKDELGDLSESFVSLETEIIDYTARISRETKEKERINAELSIASQIQAEELPNVRFADRKVKVIADYTSAKEVGGDFYDYFYIDENRFAFVIADVSGKGVPAALFMMKAKGLIKNRLIETGDIEKTVFEVNNMLMQNNKAGLFVTAFIGVVDLRDNVMQCVSAGHEKPYILDGGVTKLDVDSNFILGGQKNFVFKKDVVNLTDKKIFLFTDGLNEAINDAEEEFGYERIENALNLNNNETSNVGIIENVKSALKEFVGGADAFDDVTLMLVDFCGKGKVSMEFQNPDYGAIEQATESFNAEFSYVDKDTLGVLDVFIDEIINNFVSYEKHDGAVVTFSAEERDGEIVMIFTSNGKEFNPLSVEEKYIDEGDSAVSIGGFGITITKKLSDGFYYSRENDKNVITVVKRLF